MTFYQKIKLRRNQLNMSQQELAEKVGYKTASAINKIELGLRDINQSKIKLFATALNTTVSWLLETDETYDNYISYLMDKADKHEHLTVEENNALMNYWNDNPDPDFIQKKEVRIAVKIPVLGYVRAGIPIDAVEEILDYEEITEDMANTGTYFCLRIKGDSMEPKFSEGDVVVIRRQETVENGDIAVVLINGNDATIKKFYRTDAGIQLVATNPSYDPLFYTPKEVDSLPVSVIGKVVELRAKF